ncbi:hypothetical protein [Devosia alba]|uniref:hypothetical protein n=1 Tax=Devosia alba TaxID=3152360 RepID=UPI003264784A
MRLLLDMHGPENTQLVPAKHKGGLRPTLVGHSGGWPLSDRASTVTMEVLLEMTEDGGVKAAATIRAARKLLEGVVYPC